MRRSHWLLVSGSMLLVHLFAPTADAIIRRHDRADSLYTALGSNHAAICHVRSGHGTLIAPRWVLTAAHVAQELTPEFDKCRFGDAAYPVANVYLHPSWIGNLGPGLAEPEWLDIGLVELQSPVVGIEPLPLYRATDEEGRRVLFVGSGKTGDGLHGIGDFDETWRGAWNEVSEVRPEWLFFLFDPPPAGQDLEGIAGPADSGTPALVQTADGWAVAGVASRNDGPNIGMQECTYGTREYYVRVSAVLPWIERVEAGEVAPRNSPAVAAEPAPSLTGGEGESFDAPLYLQTAHEIVRCLTQNDTTAYRTLFTDSGWDESIDWWKDGFAVQRQHFGPIVRAYPPQRESIRMGKFGWRGGWPQGAHFVVIFENGVGGALNIELDAEGRILHSDVFIKEEVAEYESSAPKPPFFSSVPKR